MLRDTLSYMDKLANRLRRGKRVSKTKRKKKVKIKKTKKSIREILPRIKTKSTTNLLLSPTFPSMSGAMLCSTVAHDRHRAQALRFDALRFDIDDGPSAPGERWDDDDYDPLSEAEEEAVAVDEADVPADDHSLAAMYASMCMLESRSETVIFDRDVNATPALEHEAELCRQLNGAFPKCLENQDPDNLPGAENLMYKIAYSSNFEVCQVARVMNRPHYRMQQAFAENYNVHERRTVYHGTSEAGSSLIAAVGFRGAACRRAMFGKGIYTSPNIWEALAYAKPFSNAKQVFFTVELIQGPTALGSQDQLDFGLDDDGHEVLTLTNPGATILCHAKENQLLATYRITVRFMVEHNFIQKNLDCVRLVHPDIADIIKQAKLAWHIANPSAPAAQPSSFGAPPLYFGIPPTVVTSVLTRHPARSTYVDCPHLDFSIGDKVVVTDTLKAYSEFMEMTGVVCRIVKAHTYLLCVRLDAVHKRNSVRRLNDNRENHARCSFLEYGETDLLLLTTCQVRVLHKAIQPRETRGKRKRDGNPL